MPAIMARFKPSLPGWWLNLIFSAISCGQRLLPLGNLQHLRRVGEKTPQRRGELKLNPPLLRRLPHVASVDRHHGLSHFAAEGLAKLRHVLHHAIHAELPW